jgi:hypothetical protein
MRASWKFALAVVLGVSGMGTSPAHDGDDDLIAVEARDGPLELEKLVALVADVTGEPFFFDRAALHGLRARPIEAKAIPRRRLLAYLDDQLRELGVVAFESIVADEHVHTVISDRMNGNCSRARTDAEYLPPDEIAAVADRRKIVKTTLSLRSRGLALGMSHSFCHRMADSTSSALEHIQGTTAFVIVGPAADVAPIVAEMRRLDASGIRSEFDTREEARCEALAARVTALEAALARH